MFDGTRTQIYSPGKRPPFFGGGEWSSLCLLISKILNAAAYARPYFLGGTSMGRPDRAITKPLTSHNLVTSFNIMLLKAFPFLDFGIQNAFYAPENTGCSYTML